MPAYEYTGPQGQTVVEHSAVEKRDEALVIEGVPFKRRTVPSRVSVGTGAKPETMSQKTWKGYRKLECDGKLQDRPGYLPAAKVKAALAAPEVD